MNGKQLKNSNAMKNSWKNLTVFLNNVGPKATEALIRRMFWILNGLRAIKRNIHLCVTCSEQNPKTMQKFMSE